MPYYATQLVPSGHKRKHSHRMAVRIYNKLASNSRGEDIYTPTLAYFERNVANSLITADFAKHIGFSGSLVKLRIQLIEKDGNHWQHTDDLDIPFSIDVSERIEGYQTDHDGDRIHFLIGKDLQDQVKEILGVEGGWLIVVYQVQCNRIGAPPSFDE
jgi:hypothetical protein